MKIAIVSCFYPYRGGIAQFNANLYAVLSNEHHVKAFNFTRQYPSLLFPGKTQYVTDKDTALAIESERVLDSANPFSYYSTAKKVLAYKPDV
ncbi:MAG: glycosyl transferase, partial [Paludibacteraceae bacterium]|nr:glycosyl transferase [Paludibacteraceae bacterium]